jgi:hypothetical protein
VLEVFLDYVELEYLYLKIPSMNLYATGIQEKPLDIKALMFGAQFRCNASVTRIKISFYHHKQYKHYNQAPSFLFAGVMYFL